MNKILHEIRKKIEENKSIYLPHVKNSDLEKDGAIFYMNGKNGTEFEWYVNDQLPVFMVFYHDEANLGAVKLYLCKDGSVELYLYDEKGRKLIQKVHSHVKAEKSELFKLAAILTAEADEKKIWDGDIEGIHTEVEISSDGLQAFKSRQANYVVMKNRRNILNLDACVSKKLVEEGWKVGYMERKKPFDERDSGWLFLAGNEEDSYLADHNHFMLLAVGMVWQHIDPDVFGYIDQPVGSRLIRISPKKFEIDKNDRDIYVVKRE